MDLDDRGANDPQNPPSTKGKNTSKETHADQVDNRSKAAIGGGFFDSKPTLVDEEAANPSVNGGYNDWTRPSGKGGKSDRFAK